MAVRMVPCRNTITGGEAVLPETALPHLSAWQPIDSADAPATAADNEPPAEPDAAPTRKRKAAGAATTEGE